MSSTSTKIEWTEKCWNPTRGCSRVSKGCMNCYAEYQALRQSGPGKAYEGLVKMTASGPRWTGKIKLVHAALDEPRHWRRPSRIFVNSMSDLYHEDVPLDFIQEVFTVMNECPQHQFQILTKRSNRMKQLAPLLNWTPNMWQGVSVEDDSTLYRIDDLRQVTGAHFRWISFEPLLGPIPATVDLTGIHWVVVGGESGPGFRSMDPDWARTIRDACLKQGVKFFFKQWSGRYVKPLGRKLDGREWNEYPV